MVETLIESGEPGLTPLRHIWLCVVAHVISTWGFLVSIFLPIVKEQPGMPLEVETFASRYRLMTPEPPMPGGMSPLSHNYPTQAMYRTPSFDSLNNSLDHESSGMPWNNSGFTTPSVRRSCSTSACYNFKSSRLRKEDTSTRPRANSDPTGTSSKAAIRARKCMSIANNVAANAAMPAKPLIKRARTVLQRSLSTKEGINGNDDGDDDDEERGPGVGMRTKTALKEAGVKTKNALNRSATVATAAILTASQKIAPGIKIDDDADAEADSEEGKANCDSEQKSSDDLPVVSLSQTPCQRRPKMFSRKITMITKPRFLSFSRPRRNTMSTLASE